MTAKKQNLGKTVESLIGIALPSHGGTVKNYQRNTKTGGWLVQDSPNQPWARVGDPATVKELEAVCAARAALGKVQVVEKSGLPAVVSKQELEFKAIAQEIIEATLETGNKYLRLCKFIRENKIAPKDATRWLLDLGFHKARASMINKVAQSGDEVFSQWEARQIGFHGVLKLSRENIGELKQAKVVEADPELKEALETVEAELQVVDGGGAGEKKAPRSEEDKKAAWKAAWNAAAMKVLKTSELLGVKPPKKWNIGNGFELRLVKAKKSVVPTDSETRPADAAE